MLLRRSIYLMFLFLGTFLQQGLSQYYTPIGSDTLNLSTSITAILKGNNDVDSVIVADLNGFNVGDTVMVYCTRGSWIRTAPPGHEDLGSVDDDPLYLNFGRYSFLLINGIIPGRNLVYFNNWMPTISALTAGESAQLVKVRTFRNARVTSELNAEEWDPAAGKGGVLALFVQRNLRLEADINVSGQGFTGAAASSDEFSDAECASTAPSEYDSMFYKLVSPEIIRAGRKGEGLTLTNFDLLRGKASNINGGGGGNGYLSGGGGGGNFNSGGKGRSESSTCGSDTIFENTSFGGVNMSYYGYHNQGYIPSLVNRAFFGGGGGGGIRVSGRASSNGGDGGGLVVILANTIESINGHSIRADGESVNDPVIGAGGGGGAGGAILLDVRHFKDLSISAVGGKGGDTNDPGTVTGPGGGGGGGAYWISNTSAPGLTPDITSRGQPGRYIPENDIHNATSGGPADTVFKLRVPLNGFLFNTVPDFYETCSDEIPETIEAGLPWGGTGDYLYEWLDSTENHTWQPATYGTYQNVDFAFNQPLTETTWYRRKVNSGALEDISFRIEVKVHPAITGNVISPPDTVCSGGIPTYPFGPTGPLGGGDPSGDPEYRWISRSETSDFTFTGGTDSTFEQTVPLTKSTYFAREVNWGACTDTSAPVLVMVWEQITGNLLTDKDDSICYDSAPLPVTANHPQGGEQADLRYKWESSTNITSGFTVIPGATDSTYQPGKLTATTYYRRLVLSGSDDACQDYSDTMEILNVPLIIGNTIGSDQTLCTNQTAALLTGSDPGGGFQGLYSYRWESRTLSTGWGPASGAINMKTGYDPGQMTGDTTWYRRAVGSGGPLLDVCVDHSDSVAVNVLPLITGNLITAPDTVLCQGDTLGIVTQDPSAGSAPGGGATQGGVDPTRRYQWERSFSTGQPGTWEVIPGEDTVYYSGQPVLDGIDDLFLRRTVYSGPSEQCMDMDTLRIEVHTVITGNTIEPFDSVCFADTKILSGNSPSGEQGLTPVYTWKDLDAGADIPGSDQKDLIHGPYDQLGSYHYERQVEIGACQDISNSMQITVMQLPGGRLTDNPFQACEGESELNVALNMDHLSTFVGPWMVTFKNQVDTGLDATFVSGDGPVLITLDIDADSLELNYEIESIIYRSVEGRYECAAPADSLSGVVPIYVYRTPEPTINGSVSSSDAVCGPAMDLTVNTDRGTGSWRSNPSGAVFDPGASENDYIASIPDMHDAYGEYQLIFTSVAGVCADTAILNARFDEQPAPPLPGPDTMIYLRDSYQMRAEPPTAGTGTWTVEQASVNIVDPNDPHTMVENLETGKEITFTWEIRNGVCMSQDTTVIVLRNEIKRYNGFSPNGDMQNEYYIMQGLAYAEEFTISFFNALGDKVRTVTSETIEELRVDEALIANGLKEDERVVWDGYSDNGNLVPSGTYYFVINFKYRTNHYEYKDYVVVMRD